jgi:CheY-like chemotaxis protein
MTRRILLADDSVTIQKVIELTFMDEDYEVTAVSNGDEAVARLADLEPDVVIADVHMPGANGYEVCRRSKALRREVPVLLLVGTFEPFDEAQSRAAGADAYLKKPFDSQELLQLVGRLLEQSNPPGEAPAEAAPAAAAEPYPPGPTAGAQAPGQAPSPAPSPASSQASSQAIMAEPLDDLEVQPPWSNFELEPEPAPAGGGPALAAVPGWQEAEAPAFTPVEEQVFDLEDTGALDDSMLGTDVPPLSAAEAEALPFDDSFGRSGAATPFEATADERAGVPLGAAPLAGGLGEVEQAVAEHEGAPAFIGDVEAPDFSDEAQAPAGMDRAGAGSVPASAAAAPGGSAGLSDADVDRIARRLVELLGERVVRDVAWEVVPDMAELVIKDRLRELESQVD